MKTFIVLLVSVLGCTIASAQPADPAFLAPGKDFVIRFASKELAFNRVAISQRVRRAGDKPPVTEMVTERATLEIFKVVRLGKDASWAELEYPRDSADYGKWNEKRKAMALLIDTNIKDLEASEVGKEELKKLRERAAAPIKTKRSWINLAYVFQVSEVPSEFPDLTEPKVSEVELLDRLQRKSTPRIRQAIDIPLPVRPVEQPLINDIRVPEKTEEKGDGDKP